MIPFETEGKKREPKKLERNMVPRRSKHKWEKQSARVHTMCGRSCSDFDFVSIFTGSSGTWELHQMRRKKKRFQLPNKEARAVLYARTWNHKFRWTWNFLIWRKKNYTLETCGRCCSSFDSGSMGIVKTPVAQVGVYYCTCSNMDNSIQHSYNFRMCA